MTIYKEWEKDGYKFQIRELTFKGPFNEGSYFCGYIGAPPEKGFSNGLDCDVTLKANPNISIRIDVHGGVTYSSNRFIETEKFKGFRGMVIGFDCYHYGDLFKGQKARMEPHLQGLGTRHFYKDEVFVTLELENMYEQLKSYE